MFDKVTTGKNPSSDIVNLPNTVSFIRILMAPVLFVLALNQQPVWFLGILIFSEFTDILDGFLARKLHQVTRLGAQLDSWGDFIIYSSTAICAWILWPETVKQHPLPISLIIASFTLPVILGLIKFRTLTSYHTWSVKIAVATTIIAYLLLFSGVLDWPINLAAVACLYAALEEIFITLIIKQERTDIRSILQAIRYRKQINIKNSRY
ncbi:CDP-diacylglycerol--glycerol-3-phosphate 3-phosphatidyltransferase [hydrothermal vent metagenome]|uniref:CDP-diacylglycerol--glycerol-3-phosphate 3-phosphatidyltransferase n=1 Tax=hydrothermal vent metagenome TaxID=652676 RepID=A0A3B0X9T7_9ZZZZ